MKKPTDLDVIDAGAFNLSGRATTPEMYADGFSQLLIGFPLTKIVLHSVFDPKSEANAKEERTVVATICIPTISAIQLATTILAGCKSSESQIGLFADQYSTQIKTAIAQLAKISLPAGMDVENALDGSKL